MNWYTIFYFFSIADRLGSFFGWMTFIFTAINIIAWIWFLIYKGSEGNDKENDVKVMRKWIWFSTIPCIIFWLAYIATPSKKDMLLIIAGGSVGEFITTDTTAKKLPADITRFLHAEIVKATAEVNNEKPNPEIEKIKQMSKDQLEKLLLDQLDKKNSLNTK